MRFIPVILGLVVVAAADRPGSFFNVPGKAVSHQHPRVRVDALDMAKEAQPSAMSVVSTVRGGGLGDSLSTVPKRVLFGLGVYFGAFVLQVLIDRQGFLSRYFTTPTAGGPTGEWHLNLAVIYTIFVTYTCCMVALTGSDKMVSSYLQAVAGLSVVLLGQLFRNSEKVVGSMQKVCYVSWAVLAVLAGYYSTQ